MELHYSRILFVTTQLVVLISASKMICYYNSQSYWRQGVGKITYQHLKPALEHCDYLIYCCIGLNPSTYQAESLDKKLDLKSGKNNFKALTDFKNAYPGMKTLLSIGGFMDDQSPEKYLKMIENRIHRINFICSLMSMLTEYNFDGVDLAWEFPVILNNSTKVTEILWKTVKDYMTFFIKDDNPEEHRKFFVQLCKELRAAVNGQNKTLTLSISVNSNFKVYYDLKALNEYVEQIHVLTFDYRSPQESPTIGDYPAPLYPVPNRDPDRNVEATVNYMLNSTIPAEKIIMSIPTFARSWKLTSKKTATPPVPADGPGEEGQYTEREGLLAYYEICLDLTTLSDSSSLPSTYYTIAADTNTSYGLYAYRLSKSLFGSNGAWISYETPDTAALKGSFARVKGLGGIAVVDLTLDDFKGHCLTRQDLFPIVRAARASFMGLKKTSVSHIGDP